MKKRQRRVRSKDSGESLEFRQRTFCLTVSTFRVLHVDQRHNVSLELSVLLLLRLRGYKNSTVSNQELQTSEKESYWKTQTFLILLNIEATKQHNSLSSVDATIDLVGRFDVGTVLLVSMLSLC